jgi:predicted ATPase
MPAFADRGRFVGREAELRRLEAAYGATAAGQAGLVLVVGEPGIGKTALCGRLAAHAAHQAAQVLIGHCYEEGSLSLPYLPFVEELRTYALNCPPARLAAELG